MKRLSWEIILAGLFFVAIAIYLIGKSSTETPSRAEAPTEPSAPSRVHVIDVESLQELAALKELESLKGADQAENLRKLKALAHLIPSETRDEFLTEIDNVLKEFSNGDIEINFDSDDQLIIINREYDNLEQASWGETSPGIYTYLNEFDASKISTTSISLPAGSISIIGTNETKAKFTIQASGKISSKEDLGTKIRTESSISDGEAVFTIQSINDSSDVNLQLQTTLYVPQNMGISGHTDAGHIEVTNITGNQVYETGGGHIKLNRVNGDIVAVSAGGHVTIEEASGDITMRSLGGHLILKRCKGNATLDTKGGNIEIENVSGEIISKTLGGNILLSSNNVSSDITAETSAGNIEITIPSNSSTSIEIQASNMIELKGFSATAFEGNKTKNKLLGTLNGGGAEIIAFTKYGKVVILGNE